MVSALLLGLSACGPSVYDAPWNPNPTQVGDPTSPTGTTTDPGTTPGTTPTVDCGYPEAAPEMALNEVLPAFRWSEARHRDGRIAPLSLVEAYCNSSTDIDWSPFDVLLFVSIPAW